MSKTMPILERNPFADTYVNALSAFIQTIEVSDLNDVKVFHDIIFVAFRLYGFEMQEMTESIKMSKAAASKWVNRLATPAAPVRVSCLSWILTRAKRYVAEYREIPG
jgi:hypothetical protein